MGKKAKGVSGSGLGPKKQSNTADQINLKDGTKVPVALPPGIDPAVGAQVIEYLKSNPQMAKQSYDQAQRFMQNPGMAQQMVNLQHSAAQATTEQREKLATLKADPELKLIFDDIEENGPSVMERYWNDPELMSKIASKMGAMKLAPGKPQPTKKAVQRKIETLQDAAKAGDVEAAKKLLAEGADVDGKDDRGITPLGVAVGFNKIPIIKEFLEAGADVEVTDPKGNTALHYAAGYGRKEAAQLLVAKGARIDVRNTDKQTPAGVAQLNRELQMVSYLEECSEAEGGIKFL